MVPELLVDRAEPGVAEVMRKNLREQFPVAEMTQCNDDWPTISQFAMHFIESFRRNKAGHTFRWHSIKFDAGEKIRAKPLKVSAHQTADLAGGLFPKKSDLQIAPGEAAVMGRAIQPRKPNNLPRKKITDKGRTAIIASAPR